VSDDSNLTFVIPTINEQSNIGRCIEAILNSGFRKILVVDSMSSDQTVEIAMSYGCETVSRPFNSFSEKMNWVANEYPFETEWVVRVDADEVIEGSFYDKWVSLKKNKNGYKIQRRLSYKGKILKYGGWGRLKDIRVWRKGCIAYQNSKLDEQIYITSNLVGDFHVQFIDESNKRLKHDDNIPLLTSEWLDKHNRYSTYEATTFISDIESEILDFRKILKKNVYYRIPIFIRPFVNFFVRYILLLGFLDGKRGFEFHILHSLFYRFIVDCKIDEMSDS